ncbi:MAG: hypothetical protein JOZ96_28905 [Acidobacteria bacterium]|nr:hypothetical protein [Acidobacteriota bacterium]
MSNLALHPVPGAEGLYSGGASGPVALYYQSLSGNALGDTPDPAAVWDSDDGCWFVTAADKAVANPATFKQNLAAVLGPVQTGTNSRWLAWIADPNASQADLAAGLINGGQNARLLSILKSSDYQVIGETVFPFGNLTLHIPEQSTVVLDTTAWEFQITSTRTNISLQGTVNTEDIGVPAVAIPLLGEDLGTIGYHSQMLSGDLYSLFLTVSTFGASPGPEFQYTFGSGNGVTALRYPFFMGALSQNGDNLFLAPRFDPLNPVDADRTIFALDLAQFTSGVPTCDFFFSPFGNVVPLTPQARSGFALGRRYDSQTLSGDFVSYLIPGGLYMIAKASATPKIVLLMCGLWGTEFLLAGEGDLLEFSCGGAAAARGYDPSGGAGVDTALTGPFDTAYVRLIPGGGASPFSGDIKQSYCVLALNSVYYDCETGTPIAFAIGCLITDLSDVTKTTPFPMVPYGAVYAPDANGDVIDVDVPAGTLESYEVDVLASARRGMMKGNFILGPIFFSLTELKPLAGGTVRTGTGLLVELNDGTETPPHPGTWKRLMLAKSPVNDDQLLSFDASDVTDPAQPKVVSPYLSNALLQGAPFVVIGKKGGEQMAGGRTPLGGFTNELQLGEFTFKVDVGDQPPAPDGSPVPGAIIIFKYSSHASVLELYEQAVKWTYPETFVGGPNDVADVQKRIRDNFIASGLIQGPGNPSDEDRPLFDDFNGKMQSKEWTGMVVLNCPLDYSQLPIDLQVLLGGIKQGVLDAHHFGLTSNQLTHTDQGACVIDQSSLFGLVHHDETLLQPANDPDFQLLKLNALFVNSALTHFDSRIAVSVKKLFGDPTALQPNANAPNDKPEWGTVAIDGTYQKRGATGVVVFETSVPRTFAYAKDKLRALDQMLASDIALTPKRRVPAAPRPGDKTTIYAAISIAGQLGFRPDISAGQSIDLFSYKVPASKDRGLGFASYNLDMTTVIPATSEDKRPFIDGAITTDLDAATLDATGSGLRDDSLISTFPLKLLGLRHSADGMTAESVGGKQVGVDNAPPAADPVYALELKMIMGSAGSLQTDKTPLEGSLLVGWKPSGSDDTDDGFGVLFAPPTAMGRGDSLALEGVLHTVFGGLTLSKLDVGQCSPGAQQFVLEVADVVFWILSLPFSGDRRTLTMFGDPKSLGEGESQLSWFMGVPGTGGNTTLSTGFIFAPILGFMSGLKVNTDLTSTMPLQDALSQLTTITTIDINNVVSSICTGQGISETQVTYDPSAGLLFFLNLNLTMFGVTIQGLFADPTFYGGRIAFGSPPESKKSSALFPFLKVLDGLSIEFDYRKISDGLGVYSFDIQFARRDKEAPDGSDKKVPIIQIGEAQIVLPSVGVNVWTNGDWKVAVGWPFSSTKTFYNGQPLKIYFQAGPFPLEIQAGFYCANLHPQDVPAVFGGCPFGLIKMGGAELAFGVAKDLKFGPVEGVFEMYGSLSVQAMTASNINSGSQGAIDYYWFDITVGITIHAEAEINLAIIQASLDIEAAIEVSVAVETSHQTVLVIEAGLKVDLTVKVLFFTIDISFTINVTILEKTFGADDLAPASTDGPTPKLVQGLCTG